MNNITYRDVLSVANNFYESAKIHTSGYLNKIPKEWARGAAQSFIYSSVIVVALSGNPVIALSVGALAATASVISTLTKPLFKSIFENSCGNEKWYQTFSRQMIALTVTSLVLGGPLGIAISIPASAILSLFTHSLNNWKDTPYLDKELIIGV